LQNDDSIVRQNIYLSWFHDQIDPSAAQIGSLRIDAMKRTRVYRKGAANIEGPDVTFAGDLAVVGSGPFAALLARGIGRHRAFGFGMLLLSPAA
jgi:CRISPR system Cascade subunit CasE